MHYLCEKGMLSCIELCIEKSCDVAAFVHWKNKKQIKAIEMCENSENGQQCKNVLFNGVSIKNIVFFCVYFFQLCKKLKKGKIQ